MAYGTVAIPYVRLRRTALGRMSLWGLIARLVVGLCTGYTNYKPEDSLGVKRMCAGPILYPGSLLPFGFYRIHPRYAFYPRKVQ
jgi:hypothetical protein